MNRTLGPFCLEDPSRRSSIFCLTGILCVLASLCSACGGGGSGHGRVASPSLSLSSNAVSFSAVQGSPFNPADASVNVNNTGAGTLNFTATVDQPWLTVTPTDGTAPVAMQIFVETGILAANTYTGHVTVTDPGASGSPAIITVTFTVGSQNASNAPFWPQWGANPQHSGMVAATGQPLNHTLANFAYDPFVEQEKAENTPFFGEPTLTVHEQAPIVDGTDTYMVMKKGDYNSCSPVGQWEDGGDCGPNSWNSMIWTEQRFSWVNNQLVEVWNFGSDWVPEPNATDFSQGFPGLQGWEPVFHPVDANNFLYVPGAAGTVWKVDKNTGISASLINPFVANAAVTAANTFVSGPLTADANGNIYYDVIQLNLTGNPWNQNDIAGAWLVKIAPDDSFITATFASITPGAPAGTSLTCPGTFGNQSPQPALPWPPAPDAVAPFFSPACGSQRPGINVAPAVSADGATVYTVSRAHFDNLASYLLAVNTADLSPKWQASLQSRLSDGCGVLLPIAAQGVTNEPNSCLFGTTVGVDPTTNTPGSGMVIDQASSSPTVLPDASVVFGSLDNYNFSRGHLFRFDSLGNYVGAYGFGWDSTPGVWAHDNTFSVVIKDNHYPSTSYCNSDSPVCASTPAGPYYITQLDANFNIQWQFQSTTMDTNHPNGFEWCINMPAIDMLGNVYVNSEDGNVYELPQSNSGIFTAPTGKMFLNSAIGAAYTPISIGPDGKLYTQNNGQLFVVGN
jgi:BACON domain-containing protein